MSGRGRGSASSPVRCFLALGPTVKRWHSNNERSTVLYLVFHPPGTLSSCITSTIAHLDFVSHPFLDPSGIHFLDLWNRRANRGSWRGSGVTARREPTAAVSPSAFRPGHHCLTAACRCHGQVNVLDTKTNPQSSPGPTSHPWNCPWEPLRGARGQVSEQTSPSGLWFQPHVRWSRPAEA